MGPFGGGGALKRSYSTLQYLMHAPHFIRLFWRLLQDKRVGLAPKLVLVVGLIYFVAPLDLIPDFPLVGLGWTDDIIVLYLAAKAFVRLCPRQVVAEHVALIDQGA